MLDSAEQLDQNMVRAFFFQQAAGKTKFEYALAQGMSGFSVLPHETSQTRRAHGLTSAQAAERGCDADGAPCPASTASCTRTAPLPGVTAGGARTSAASQ